MSDSAETVALGLLEILLRNEKLTLELRERPPSAAKKWLYNSYAECLRAVHTAKERAADPIAAPKVEGHANAEGGAAGGWDPNAQGWSALPDHKE